MVIARKDEVVYLGNAVDETGGANSSKAYI